MKITITLDNRSIDKAIKELRQYEAWLKKKTDELCRELAGMGAYIAQIKFNDAVYDGVNDVSVRIEDGKNGAVAVVATGRATLFIEFGTGVRHGETHPEAAELGFTRGGYGHGYGSQERGWWYTGNNGGTNGQPTRGRPPGTSWHTYGNPANMCMYKTVRELEQKVEDVARRVFMHD